MEFEQDYIMRMIKSMGQMILKLFGKKDEEREYSLNGVYTATDQLYVQLLEMADSGAINEAENLLFRNLDRTDRRYLEMAMNFYQHVDEYPDEFLAANGYSRPEIVQGICMMASEFGITGIEHLFEDD